ncbi:GerW family sporulation protein [Desertibacillus haloalkaliphilus]|uniref:GerW family sporulation protein n=1 Tax=Desertibacillus haloalkaliphilus TaxID=1328930 RepID=UPI001C2520F2|nr:GerW family sporulation protein [Desertibacillus haloalkaliphilus]MBU8905190.1 GerW family sporulation protein [Desertibacillus haloalkaliphilus]
MSEHPIQGLMMTAMENLKEMVDVNTIVGDPVETPDGSVILPVSKVGFGFAAGGSQFTVEDNQNPPEAPFGGGSGGGVSITPIAFLVVNGSGVKMIHIDGNTHLYEKLLDFAPQVIEKIQQMVGNNQSNQQTSTQTTTTSTMNQNPTQDDDNPPV